METARLRIRRFTVDDADAIYGIHGNTLASQYIGGTLSREESLQNIQALIARVDATGYGPFAVTFRDSTRALGWAGVQQLPGYLRIEVLFGFCPEFWGHGYASEATHGLLSVCFGELALKEVVATVDERNLASIAVLAKNGFSLEGPFTHKLRATSGQLFRATPESFAQCAARRMAACGG